MFRQILKLIFQIHKINQNTTQIPNNIKSLLSGYVSEMQEYELLQAFKSFQEYTNTFELYLNLLEIYYKSRSICFFQDKEIKTEFCEECKNAINFFNNDYQNSKVFNNNNTSIRNIILSVLSSLLLNALNFSFKEDLQKTSINNNNENDNVSGLSTVDVSIISFKNASTKPKTIESLIFNQKITFNLVKAFISELYYIDSLEKKYNIIAGFEENKINPKTKPLNMDMIEYLTKVIQFILKNIQTEFLDLYSKIYCFIFDYFIYIITDYENYLRSLNQNKKKNLLEEPIQCSFKHLFENNSICTDFFQSFYEYFQSYLTDDNRLVSKIDFLILNLIKYHENPFIFCLLYRMIQDKKVFSIGLFKKILSIFKNEQTPKTNTVFLNIVNFLNVFYKLSIHKIPLSTEVSLILTEFIEFLIKNQICYQPFLCPACSILEMIINISINYKREDFDSILNIARIADLANPKLKIKGEKPFLKNKSDFSFFNKKCKIEERSFTLILLLKIIENRDLSIEEKQQKIKSIIDVFMPLVNKCKNLPWDENSLYNDCVSIFWKHKKESVSNDEIVKEIMNIVEREKDHEIKIIQDEESKVNHSFFQCPLKDNCLFLKKTRKVSECKIDTKDKNMTITQSKLETSFNINGKEIVICSKRDLLLKYFSIYYQDVYFYNKDFIKMEKFYQYLYCKSNSNKEGNLNYPSILKNYSPCKYFYPKLFLKQNVQFFSDSFFPISHPYFIQNNCKINDIKPVLSHILPENSKKRLFYEESSNDIYNCECELLSNTKFLFGELSITESYILFNNKPNPTELNEKYLFGTDEIEDIKEQKQIIILLKDIYEILQRRFLYNNQAIEIFLLNGKSYFFNLYLNKECDFLFKALSNIQIKLNLKYTLIPNPKEYFEQINYTSLWRKKEIDSLQYLLYLNKFAGRSYNELGQYPVLPWIFLLDKSKDLNKEGIYPLRKLEYPISVQTVELRKNAQENYDNIGEYDNYQCHFRLHYSTSAYVILYLARLSPYTEQQIKLQGNKFESPNRQFSSFESLYEILESNLDNRELIPEMYMTFEYFYNLNKNFFGFRTADKSLVDNLEIPIGFNSSVSFTFTSRLFLNSKFIRKNLNKWIDNIFGFYQICKEKSRCNLYKKVCYSDNINLIAKKEKYKNKKLSLEEISMKLKPKKIEILSFGQTPMKLFDKKHEIWQHEDNMQERLKDENDDIAGLAHERGRKIYEYPENVLIVYVNFTTLKDKIYLLKKIYQKTNEIPKKAPYYEIEVRELSDIHKSETIKIKKLKMFHKIFVSSSALKRKMQLNDQNIETNANNSSNFESNKCRHPVNSHYLKNPKYSIFDIDNGQYFVTGRNYDNTIIIYKTYEKNNNKPFKTLITGSFVSVVVPTINNKFISGHKNGKIIEWEIQYQTIIDKKKREKKEIKGVKCIRDLLAHNNCIITAILYVETYNLLITAGDDGNLYIRKYYDFELMNVITTNKPQEIFRDIFFSSQDYIYAQTFVKEQNIKDQTIGELRGYSLNGLEFDRIKENFKTLYITKNGMIIGCDGKSHKLSFINGSNFQLKKDYSGKDSPEKKRITHFLFLENQQFFVRVFSNNKIQTQTENEYKTFVPKAIYNFKDYKDNM